MPLTLTRSAILTAGLLLAVPGVAHAQDTIIGDGSLSSVGSSTLSGSADSIFEAQRFNRTYTQEQITECWEAVEASGLPDLGIPPCPTRPITALDVAAAHILFGSFELLFGS